MITVSNVFSSVPPLFTSLSKVLTGDIDCSHLCLQEHSTDGSPYAVRPQAVIYPKTTADIKHAISFAREYHIPLTVAGGMTACSGGSLGEGMVLDMTRYFSHIRQVNMMEHTITVDVGVTIDELREKLSAWNMEIPVLQEENSLATVGGLIATKSATASTFYAGTIREWIEGVTVIVDTGEEHHIKDGITPSGRLLGIYQAIFPLLSEHGPTLRAARRECSDDATGYSLWNTSIGPRQLLDQLVGSEGTLAILTSVTFRVTQKKKYSSTFILPLQDEVLLETSIDIAQHHNAERLFLFDATWKKLVDTYHASLLPSTLPEKELYLMVTLRGDDIQSLTDRIQTLLKVLPEAGGIIYAVEERTASKLMGQPFLHSLFNQYSKGTHMIAPVGEGIIVPLRQYAECLMTLDRELGATGTVYTITGYAGSGHIAVTASFDAQSLAYEDNLQRYREQLFAIVSSFKGGISAVGGDGLERTAALPSVYNEATRNVFKQLKNSWDPLSIFNPSKKLQISKDYLLKHAVRSLG